MKTFLTILLALSISMGMAQTVLKGRIDCYSYKLPGQSWNKDMFSNSLIVFTNERITIYSKVTQQYDIVCETENPLNVTDDVVTTSSWKVVDATGATCTLQLVGRAKGLQLFVIYSNISFCYQFQTI